MSEMNINDDNYDFLSVNKMKKLNDKVDREIHKTPTETTENQDNTDMLFDSAKYESFIVEPKELSEDLLRGISEISVYKCRTSVSCLS